MFTTLFNPKEFCSSFLFLDDNEIFATDTLAHCFHRINSDVWQYFNFDLAWKAVTQQWIQVCPKAVYWIPNYYSQTGTKFGHAYHGIMMQPISMTMLYLTKKKRSKPHFLELMKSFPSWIATLAPYFPELANQHNLVPGISLEFVKTFYGYKMCWLAFLGWTFARPHKKLQIADTQLDKSFKLLQLGFENPVPQKSQPQHDNT